MLYTFFLQYDDGFNWVECDACSGWFHLMCEGLTEIDYRRIEGRGREYVCVSCTDGVNIQSKQAATKQGLMRENEGIGRRITQLQAECLELRYNLILYYLNLSFSK